MKFNEITSADAHKMGRSLCQHYTLGEVMFFPAELGDMDDATAQEIVDKIPKNLMPDDYEQSQNRSIIRLAGMFALNA